jgi:membrane protein
VNRAATGTRSAPAGARRTASVALRAGRSRLELTVAGRVWTRLCEVGFIGGSLQFAALFTLGFIPFLILLSAVLGPGFSRAILTQDGFSARAGHDVTMLFAHARTAPASLTVPSVILAVLGGGAVSHMVQAWYAKIFRVHVHGWKAMARRVEWLAVVFGYLALQVLIARRVQPHGGYVAAASAQFFLALAFWWWSLHALLAAQIPWRRLFPAGLATAVCCSGLGLYITYVASTSIVANEARYGPIGAVTTLLSAEIGLGVSLHLGAVVGATIGRRKDPAISRG